MNPERMKLLEKKKNPRKGKRDLKGMPEED